METIILFLFYFLLYNFLFNPLFSAFLQQFTASENLKVPGDSTCHRRILTTLGYSIFWLTNLTNTRHFVLCLYEWIVDVKNSKSITHFTVLSLGIEYGLSYPVMKTLSHIIKPNINKQGRVIANVLI